MSPMEICILLTSILFLVLAIRTREFTKNLMTLSEQEIIPHVQWPKLSIVIPACNEADTIEEAGRSLLTLDYPNLEVIFVNDRSTDNTGEIIDRLAASDPHFRALHIETLPDGWLGKVHALSEGLKQTTGEWVLLTDADVHFSSESLKKAISYNLRNSLDFLTVIPDLVTKTFFLQVMMAQLYHQASLLFEPRKLNDPNYKICYGQGAFLLCKRETYEQSEGLEWLKMEVVDDTGFAFMLRRAGARMGALSGRHEVKLEWYPSLRAMMRGLEKNSFALCQYSMTSIIFILLGTWLIFSSFMIFPFLLHNWIAGLGTLVSLGIYLLTVDIQLKKLMAMNPFSVLLFPISFALLPLIFLRSGILALFRKGIYWRGTFYSLVDLKAKQRMKVGDLLFTKHKAKKIIKAYSA